MDIAPPPIKLVRQDPDSDDCLRACALMVFRYFKEPITKDEVWKNLHVYKKHSGLFGGYLSDLGKIANKKGYKTIVFHYATHRWSKDALEATGKGKKVLVKKLKEIKKNSSWPAKKRLNKSISYLKTGGQYKVVFPKLSSIDNYLMQRIPVIISVRAENFYQNPKAVHSHYILVIGKKSGKYVIRDPYLAVNLIDENELLYAWMRNGGWMMVLLPPKRKPKAPKVKQQRLKL